MIGATGGWSTSNERTTSVAALKVAVAGDEAVKVHVPGAKTSTVKPVTVQTFGVEEVTVGMAPDVAFGANVKFGAVAAWFAGAAKVMVFAFSAAAGVTFPPKISEKTSLLVQLGASVVRVAPHRPDFFIVIIPPRATSQMVGVLLVNHHHPTS
jgi:hypothetical protein